MDDAEFIRVVEGIMNKDPDVINRKKVAKLLLNRIGELVEYTTYKQDLDLAIHELKYSFILGFRIRLI